MSRSLREKTTTIAPKRLSRRWPSRCGRRYSARRLTTCRPPRERWGSRVSDVVILDSGVANLASIAGAFRRLNASVVVTADPAIAGDATRLVLPGVGAFGAGMGALRSHDLHTVIRDRASRGTPILGICLGMQMLCEASEEAPGVAGLGVVAGTCRRLPSHVRIPHLGWNTVTPEPEARLLTPGVAAFANSYALCEGPTGWTTAGTTHGVPFIAALEREPTLACQFHPELSGGYGAELLERWLTGRTARPSPAGNGSPGLGRRIPLTVGGGVRSVDDARCLLSAGADKVSVNTAAVRRPELLTELAQAFGCQCVVLAIDARRAADHWEVLVIGGREVARPDAVTWAREGERLGAGEILLTSWDRDGTRAGHDTELLRAVADAVRVPVIASGGVGTREHVAAAFAAGADAVLAASVFHHGDDTVDGIKADLAVRGIRVRR